MTQVDRQLLLADLCGRLPYGVKVSIEYSKGKYTHIYDLREIDNDTTSELRQQVTVWNYGFYSSVISYPLIICRPYLRPMSSMTEEEKEEMYHDCYIVCIDFDRRTTDMVAVPNSTKIVDWLNKHHFDYRGLIDKGLAIAVTEENNPYKS